MITVEPLHNGHLLGTGGGEGCVLKTKTYDLESDKKVYCSLIEKKYEIRLLSPSTSLYGLKSR